MRAESDARTKTSVHKIYTTMTAAAAGAVAAASINQLNEEIQMQTVILKCEIILRWFLSHW